MDVCNKCHRLSCKDHLTLQIICEKCLEKNPEPSISSPKTTKITRKSTPAKKSGRCEFCAAGKYGKMVRTYCHGCHRFMCKDHRSKSSENFCVDCIA